METIVNRRSVVPAPTRRQWLASAAAASLALPGWAQPRPGAEWVIGQSLPLSGPMAPTLNGLTGGSKLAFDEINRQGGIDGRPLRLVQLDDGFDPARIVANVRQLVAQEQAIALLGTVGTAQTAAALPLEAAGADARVVAEAAYASQPQAVLMIVAGPAVVPFVKASHARKGIPLYTLSLSVGSAILNALGPDAYGLAVARVTPYPWRATTPLARGFQQAMERAGQAIDYDHYAGYINARVIVEGLRAAGRAPTGESVAQGLARLGTVDLQGYKLSDGPGNHHGSDFVEIAVVGKDGRFLR